MENGIRLQNLRGFQEHRSTQIKIRYSTLLIPFLPLLRQSRERSSSSALALFEEQNLKTAKVHDIILISENEKMKGPQEDFLPKCHEVLDVMILWPPNSGTTKKCQPCRSRQSRGRKGTWPLTSFIYVLPWLL